MQWQHYRIILILSMFALWMTACNQKFNPGDDLRGANLFGEDLVGDDLHDINFSQANLAFAQLEGANVTKSIFTEADLRESRWNGAILIEADMGKAHLYRAILWQANLSKANLTEADLLEADFTDADLSQANLTGAHLARTNFSRANLRAANLTDANLFQADLTGAHLNNANLERANITEVKGLTDVMLQATIGGDRVIYESSWDDLEMFCRREGKKPLSGAAVFEPNSEGIPSVDVVPFNVTGKEWIYDDIQERYDDFHEKNKFGPRPRMSELIACVELTSVTYAKDCLYGSRLLTNYDSIYGLKLYAAKTGELLSSTTAEVSGQCPSAIAPDHKGKNIIAGFLPKLREMLKSNL